MVLPLQGASPPAISCRPFRPDFEIPVHLIRYSATYFVHAQGVIMINASCAMQNVAVFLLPTMIEDTDFP